MGARASRQYPWPHGLHGLGPVVAEARSTPVRHPKGRVSKAQSSKTSAILLPDDGYLGDPAQDADDYIFLKRSDSPLPMRPAAHAAEPHPPTGVPPPMSVPAPGSGMCCDETIHRIDSGSGLPTSGRSCGLGADASQSPASDIDAHTPITRDSLSLPVRRSPDSPLALHLHSASASSARSTSRGFADERPTRARTGSAYVVRDMDKGTWEVFGGAIGSIITPPSLEASDALAAQGSLPLKRRPSIHVEPLLGSELLLPHSAPPRIVQQVPGSAPASFARRAPLGDRTVAPMKMRRPSAHRAMSPADEDEIMTRSAPASFDKSRVTIEAKGRRRSETLTSLDALVVEATMPPMTRAQANEEAPAVVVGGGAHWEVFGGVAGSVKLASSPHTHPCHLQPERNDCASPSLQA